MLAVLPLNLRKTQVFLNRLEVGEIEVKKRGIDDVTASQFKRLKLEGKQRATVLLTRLGRSRIAVIAKRRGNPLVNPDPPSDLLVVDEPAGEAAEEGVGGDLRRAPRGAHARPTQPVSLTEPPVRLA